MSSYEYCPRGGQEGIYTTSEQQLELADLIKSRAYDEYVPIPNVQPERQIVSINTKHDHNEVVDYWENERGQHGWCCAHCGKVVQWG